MSAIGKLNKKASVYSKNTEGANNLMLIQFHLRSSSRSIVKKSLYLHWNYCCYRVLTFMVWISFLSDAWFSWQRLFNEQWSGGHSLNSWKANTKAPCTCTGIIANIVCLHLWFGFHFWMMSDFPDKDRLFNDQWWSGGHSLNSSKADAKPPYTNLPSVFSGDLIVKNFSGGNASVMFLMKYFHHIWILRLAVIKSKCHLSHEGLHGVPRKLQDLIILVGTNNLSANHTPDAVAKGITNLVEVISHQAFVSGIISPKSR